jgi:SAM-dependent methyltransferase
MKRFSKYTVEWEKNAQKDAFWAILTSEKHEEKQWEQNEFFQTGIAEIRLLKTYIQKHNLSIPFKVRALDFGCGVGRLTQALGKTCDEVYGIDISNIMIEKAKSLNTCPSLKFIHNPHPNLHIFDTGMFDLIYSNIVLQHIAKKFQLIYLAEFARVLKPNGWLIIQIPSRKIFATKFEKIKSILASFFPGKMKKIIQLKIFKKNLRAIKDFDFEMNVCSEKLIARIAAKNRLEIKHIAYTNSCDANFSGNLMFYPADIAKKQPGFLSPMYFMQKSS